MKILTRGLLLLFCLVLPQIASAKKWTLEECISYALANNISLQKTRINRLSAHEDVLQAKADLWPSLNAQTSQSLVWQPFPETGRYTVNNGTVEASIDKVYYNGSYGLNLNWTVWNGNRNRNQIKADKLIEEQAVLDSAMTANSIQEQIVQLYIQILYSADAIDVYKQSLLTSKKNEERGKVMVEVGKMSRADMAQLSAQRAQDEYNIVAAESTLSNYKRQLKQLLEITDNEEFDVLTPTEMRENALQDIPSMSVVYDRALTHRPEIRSQELAIEQSEVNLSIAKAQGLPTISVTSGIGSNTTSMSDNGWGKQMKNNLNMSAGVTVSVPILDNRQRQTAVNKARLAKESSILELRNQHTQLYSTIENYWLQAVTNQSKYRAALTNTESQQMSYEMLSEQFRLGLKNIIELMNGKTNLLTAQQSELESKYLTLYNIKMLQFYQNGDL
ncbi:MAG: TolC family protein [Prevotella sp.]|nr:TolC family protein [Prevotella sp.]